MWLVPTVLVLCEIKIVQGVHALAACSSEPQDVKGPEERGGAPRGKAGAGNAAFTFL
jgi:hypothetical protein